MRRNLQKAREQKGLTQNEVAEMLGVSHRYYQMLEKGDRDGNFEIWDALEDVFKVHQRILRDQKRGPADNPEKHAGIPQG